MIQIGGLQKLTLLDYPGLVACTVFTVGCNFRCPFCHNRGLLTAETISQQEVSSLLDFLRQRRGKLDGVCITGGEPLLQDGLPWLLDQIKALGYLVKLDTNGSFPNQLQTVVLEHKVDFVAMDIKNALSKYALTTGCSETQREAVEESAAFLMEGHVPYEFRTTVVRELHCPEDLVSIGRWIAGSPAYYLQGFVDSGQVLQQGLHSYTAEEMKQLQQVVLPWVPTVRLRGI